MIGYADARADVVEVLSKDRRQVFEVIADAEIDGDLSSGGPVIHYKGAETRDGILGADRTKGLPKCVRTAGCEIGYRRENIRAAETVRHGCVLVHAVDSRAGLPKVTPAAVRPGVAGLVMPLAASSVAVVGSAKLNQSGDVDSWSRRVVCSDHGLAICELKTKIADRLRIDDSSQ